MTNVVEAITIRSQDLRATITVDAVVLERVGPRGGKSASMRFPDTDPDVIIALLGDAQSMRASLRARVISASSEP